MLTNYTVKKEGERFTVYDKGKLLAKGMPTEEMALHAIWSSQGKVVTDFYSLDGEKVIKKNIDQW